MVRYNFQKKKTFLKRNKRRLLAPNFIATGDLRKEKKEKAFISKQKLKIIIVILSAVTLLYFVFYSNVFAISEIIVEGNKSIESEEIISRIGKGENIFLFDIEKNKKTLLDDLPEIKEAQIYRGLPNAIKVIILERDGQLVWQTADKKYLISSRGEVSKEVTLETESSNLPLIIDMKGIPVEPGAAIASPSFVSFIMNVNDQFDDNTNINILNFEINETTFDVTVRTEAGFAVKLNSLRSSKKQLDDLKRVLIEKRNDIKEYVDLRIDGWAYYK